MADEIDNIVTPDDGVSLSCVEESRGHGQFLLVYISKP